MFKHCDFTRQMSNCDLVFQYNHLKTKHEDKKKTEWKVEVLDLES